MKTFHILEFLMMFIFGAFFTSCSSNNDSQSNAQEVNIDSLVNAKVEERLNENANSDLNQDIESNQDENTLVGTYEITEDSNSPKTIILTVNADETATMRYKDSEHIHYGSWYKYSHMKYAKFHFVEESNWATNLSTIPSLYFRAASKDLDNFVIMDGYLYSSSNAADAKNPNERLKLKRISAGNYSNTDNMTQEQNTSYSDQTAYFVVISSTVSLEEAKNKANSIGGLVIKGFANDRTRYRVCTGVYNSKQEAQSHLIDAKEYYADNAWILSESKSAIVYP